LATGLLLSRSAKPLLLLLLLLSKIHLFCRPYTGRAPPNIAVYIISPNSLLPVSKLTFSFNLFFYLPTDEVIPSSALVFVLFSLCWQDYAKTT